MSDHAEFEAAYWGDCTNTFDEEQKHYIYANCMGIRRVGYALNAGSKRILDVGGGPASMLLKCVDLLPRSRVIDPLADVYPNWVADRYDCKKIALWNAKGEDPEAFLPRPDAAIDEVWIYNCLQHVDDPAKIIANAKVAAPVLRMFEWVDIPPHDGHPHMLTRAKLEEWIGQRGEISDFAESGCYGRAFYGAWTHAAGLDAAPQP